MIMSGVYEDNSSKENSFDDNIKLLRLIKNKEQINSKDF